MSRTLARLRIVMISVLLASIFSVPVLANENTARSTFEDGKSAFRKGDYQTALTSFEQSREAGQSGPAIHYNIGVCNYKLGNYLDAWSAFREVAEYPSMAPLAYYNLGLIEMARGNPEAADNWFRLTLQHAQDEKLQAMAERMLGAEKAAKPISAWHGIILAEAGYDDNVRLRNELFSLPGNLSLDSPVGLLFGSVSGPYTRDGRFLFDARFFLTQNLDADDLDQFEVMGGGRYFWAPGSWRIELGGLLGYSTLGGKSYEEKGLLSFKARKPLTDKVTMDLWYTYEDISAGDKIFDPINGSRQRVRIRGVWRDKRTSIDLSYDYVTNNRDGASVSPDRNRVRARYTYLFGSKWSLKIRASYRRSKYKDLPSQRTEDLMMTGMKLARRLGSKWEIYGDYILGDNDSDDDAFSYTRNRIVLGTSYIF